MTATAGRPEQVTFTSTGGAARGDELSGTITTVRRRSLSTLLPITRHGRVLLISDPTVGSRLAHQISPRRGIFPRFRHSIGKSVEFQLDFSHLGILICHFAGANQPPIAFGELVGQRIGDIARTVPSRDSPGKAGSQSLRQRKCHLTASHTAILPYFWQSGYRPSRCRCLPPSAPPGTLPAGSPPGPRASCAFCPLFAFQAACA